MRLGLLLAAAAMLAAQAELPEGPGRETAKKVCGGCHDFTVITQNRYSKDRWEQVVEGMVSRGAEGTDQELDEVVKYLAEHFGPPQQKVNVNKAAAEELAKGLGFSRETAGAIVEYRAKHGAFHGLEELKGVPGVDGKAVEAKKEWIEY